MLSPEEGNNKTGKGNNKSKDGFVMLKLHSSVQIEASPN